MFFQMDCPGDLVTHTIINVTYYEACSHVMYIYIMNELMPHLPFINNAGPLMPFIKSCSSNIKQIVFGQSSSYRGNLRQHKEMEVLRRKTMKVEFIAQTVMKVQINGIQISEKMGGDGLHLLLAFTGQKRS